MSDHDHDSTDGLPIPPIGGMGRQADGTILSFRDHVLVAILRKLNIPADTSIQIVGLLRVLGMYQPTLSAFHDAFQGIESITPQTLSRLRSELVDPIAESESIWAATWAKYPTLHEPKLPRAALKGFLALREAANRSGDHQYTTMENMAKKSKFASQIEIVATMPYEDWYRLWFALGMPSLKERSE